MRVGSYVALDFLVPDTPHVTCTAQVMWVEGNLLLCPVLTRDRICPVVDPPGHIGGLLEGPWAAKILRVIAKEQVVPLLLEACPSFGERWTRSIADAVYEKGLLYVDLGEFAHHLVELVRAGTTSEFVAVFDVVERLHVDGDSYVKEAVTIGFLEGMQNVARNTGVDPQRFAPWLKPESAKWWAELNDFWDGEVPYVGAGLTRNQT